MSYIVIVLALPLLIGAALKGGTSSLWFRLGAVMVAVGIVLRLLGL